MFILDRVTGKPLYDVKEVPVPKSTTCRVKRPGRPSRCRRRRHRWRGSPTARTRSTDLDADDAGGLPEADHRLRSCRARCSSRRARTVAVNFFPSSLGGVDWGGGSFDPRDRPLLINVNALGSPQQLAQQPDGTWGMKAGYEYFQDPETAYPCQKPPWGELVAVDVSKGVLHGAVRSAIMRIRRSRMPVASAPAVRSPPRAD